MTKENKALKRQSQALLPFIPELPENLSLMTFDLENDPGNDPSAVEDAGADLLLQSQVQIQGGSASVLLSLPVQFSGSEK